MEANDEYKLGSHTGPIKKLTMRYITYYPNMILHFFQYLNDAFEKEEIIKKNYKNFV